MRKDAVRVSLNVHHPLLVRLEGSLAMVACLLTVRHHHRRRLQLANRYQIENPRDRVRAD